VLHILESPVQPYFAVDKAGRSTGSGIEIAIQPDGWRSKYSIKIAARVDWLCGVLATQL
jgi:hypothetical protein